MALHKDCITESKPCPLKYNCHQMMLILWILHQVLILYLLIFPPLGTTSALNMILQRFCLMPQQIKIIHFRILLTRQWWPLMLSSGGKVLWSQWNTCPWRIPFSRHHQWVKYFISKSVMFNGCHPSRICSGILSKCHSRGRINTD